MGIHQHHNHTYHGTYDRGGKSKRFYQFHLDHSEAPFFLRSGLFSVPASRSTAMARV